MKSVVWLIKLVWYIPRTVLALLILAYQKTFSPDHGFMKGLFPYGYCKYSPSCSEYAYQSIKKNGAISGSMKAIVRVLKCNPCSKGGYDPP